MDYRQHIENGSMLNTPPVFAIQCMLRSHPLVEEQREAFRPSNSSMKRKQTLHVQYPRCTATLSKARVPKEDRSKMNATFTIDNPELEKHSWISARITE